MVMQAEHIPVHLGAMPAAVAAVRDEEHAPGRAWILNEPYRGGTHLPDITVITPVYAGEELIAFAASRAHHADVGGPTPGSMPVDSRTLADEGVVIEPRVLDDAAIAGQGTMNNLTLGSEDVVYYETIGGGPGACLDPAGQARCTWR
jgi:N-methylhydantoinase B